MKKTERLDKEALLVTDGELKYIQFDSLLQFREKLQHCFTTRIGGVSTGECSSLNLGFNRKDSRENVEENFRRLCSSLDVDCGSMIFSNQVHDNKIGIVTKNDMGKGFDRTSDIKGVDGLATGERGVTLVTFYADCVPVLLYEKNGRAMASVHSGWRSTLKGITSEAVRALKDNFDTEPENLICVIGPSLGKCCFEVDEDVYEEFAARFCNDKYYQPMEHGKWKIGLREIIKDTAQKAGIPEENIYTVSICTKCRNDLFFSYRGDCRKTGSLAVLMQLKEV